MKNLPFSERGVIHLVLPFLFVVIALAVIAVLFSTGAIQNPFQNINIPFIQKAKEPTVSLTADYKNPFDKSNQYVNPFSTYKNPFDAIE